MVFLKDDWLADGRPEKSKELRNCYNCNKFKENTDFQYCYKCINCFYKYNRLRLSKIEIQYAKRNNHRKKNF